MADKNPAAQALGALGGRVKSEAKAAAARENGRLGNVCKTCRAPVALVDLRDEESAAEYRISGMCQKCQDEVFAQGGG